MTESYTTTNGVHPSDLTFSWNPKNLEIKTRTVEKTLEPLVMQVTTLVSSKSPTNKKGKSKRAIVLVAAVERATQNFVEKGEMIALEYPGIRDKMLYCVGEVRTTGEMMSATAKEFANDPCSSVKRGNMVRASRNLLTSVTRLLIIADEIDVELLMNKLQTVEKDLEYLKTVNSQAELMDGMDRFGKSAADLMNQAAKRQYELKDPVLRDDLAAARAVLKKHSMMLLTASKAYVRHPELSAAKANRDYVLRQVCDAVNTISKVAKGETGRVDSNGPGQLASALDVFDNCIILNPVNYDDKIARPELEQRLEEIISGAALVADSGNTRDERRERIVQECNAVRQALQDLLSEYMTNQGSGGGPQLETALDSVSHKMGGLRRQLRRAVVDHVSDLFMETDGPLLRLIEAAVSGSEVRVDEASVVFSQHAARLVEVANLACSVSINEEGVKMVRYAASQIQNLCPQVVNAAKILSSRPKSKVALENMEVFRASWLQQLQLLTDAVDDIVSVEDFLSVSESHILEDVNKCCLAVQEKDGVGLGQVAGGIRCRSDRIAGVVTCEMEAFEAGDYTHRVLDAIRLLQTDVLPNFNRHVDCAIDCIEEGNKGVDENEFIDACRLVYDGVREVRRAVLINREEVDSDTEWEGDSGDTELGDVSDIGRAHLESRTDSMIDEYPDISGITNAREAMKNLPEEDRAKIAQQVEVFRIEKRAFDNEVSKWDDKGNDIIVLAKHMCTIMMEMTDFARGNGPLKTTMDVINAAKKISEAGTKLDKLARAIADECPESSTKKDLIAYLQRIALYCHQLNITSKVKADVQNVSGELIVSGLDSATSLIQAAKNLMNAVVLTVKASYVASTKYRKNSTGGDKPNLVVWKVKAPEKKPLVRREAPDEVRAKIRKAAGVSLTDPFKVLSDFEGPSIE